MAPYTAFKIVHMTGIVLFLGNIIVTGVWKFMADQTGNPAVIGFAQRLVTLTDWVFTFGGVVLVRSGLVPTGGYGMAGAAGYDLRMSWLLLAQSLFVASARDLGRDPHSHPDPAGPSCARLRKRRRDPHGGLLAAQPALVHLGFAVDPNVQMAAGRMVQRRVCFA